MTSDQRSATPGRETAGAQGGENARGLSRKRALALLGAGVVGASTGALAGCESEEPATREEGESDVEVLNDSIEFEYTGVAVYRADLDFLGRELREVADRFAEQAEAHVARLSGQVRERGGTPLEPRPDARYLEKAGVAGLEEEDGFIRVAIELENAAVAGYTQAVMKLTAPELRRTFFEIAANSAAHMSVLLGIAGEIQVPDALVTGQPA